MTVSPPDLFQDFLSYLVTEGHVASDAALRIQTAQRKTGQPIDVVIRELGLMPEARIAQAIAECLQVPFREVLASPPENDLPERLGLNFAAGKAVIPRVCTTGSLILTMANPYDRDTIAAVQYFFDAPAEVEVAPRSAIDDYLRIYGNGGTQQNVGDGSDSLADTDLERLEDIARDAPVVKFVSRIIQRAIDDKASDIHLEPDETSLKVRLRRDGILGHSEAVQKSVHAGVVSRLKILARLNIAERRLPQDGRIRVAVRGQDIDLRLSVLPTVHGEAIVLRILNRQAMGLQLPALGFDPAAAQLIRKLVGHANGMVLVTGPTGSGKTTTLYSILTELNRPEVKIITVEDPVEYRLSGVTQLQTDPALGLTFATALRSILRQDPDVILVGEIRDQETAQIAVQAALTGHLVLSTLHTNSAVGSFDRLRDMGIEPFLIEATLRGVIAQRLIRRRCPACVAKANAGSCPECGGSGYRGRTTTFEILRMSPRIQTAVMEGVDHDSLESLAKEEGMVPMRDHALLLAEQNVTTVPEALRVTNMDAV